MTVIYCAECSCKHNRDSMCTQDQIGLNWHSVMTVNDGRQSYLRCRDYEESNRSKELAEFMRERGYKFGTEVK